jgi:hypothetical protein
MDAKDAKQWDHTTHAQVYTYNIDESIFLFTISIYKAEAGPQ